MANGLNFLIAQGGRSVTPPLDLLETYQNVLKTRGMERELAAYPENLNWLRTERQMKTEKFGMEKAASRLDELLKQFQVEQIPMEKELKGWELLKTIAGSGLVNKSNFSQYTDFLVRQGMNPDIFNKLAPIPNESEEAFQARLFDAALTIPQRVDLLKAQIQAKAKERPYKIGQEITREEERGKVTYRVMGYKENDEPILKEIGIKKEKTEKEYGEPYIDKETGALLQKEEGTGKIQKIATPPKGFIIESDGKGGFTIKYGTEKEMTTKTTGAIEEKILSGKEQLARIQTIASEFKPEYQEIGSRLSAEWTGIKAKLGQNVSKKDAQFLTEFKAYQRKAIENINLYIKEITGAQMSEVEASRLRLAQPDPGEKWYKGDDPITFKAKMDDVIKYTRAAVARYEWYLSQGFTPTQIKKKINAEEAIPLDAIVSEMK